MAVYRSRTAIGANAVVNNILADLRLRNVPLEFVNGALVSFACLVGVGGNTSNFSRPVVQAFIGMDQVVEEATPGSIITSALGTSAAPVRQAPQVPTDLLFANEGALPGDLIRISARGTGTATTLLWVLDVEEQL